MNWPTTMTKTARGKARMSDNKEMKKGYMVHLFCAYALSCWFKYVCRDEKTPTVVVTAGV